MRKIHAVIAAAAATLAAGTLLAGPAQAAPDGVRGPNCDRLWRTYQNDGNVRAWRDLDCTGELLGVTPGGDSNWHDGSGPFQGSDGDAATSLMNTGTPGIDNVQFYVHAGYGGGTGCVARAEYYVDSLTDNRFSDGSAANDAISSHRWSSGCTNYWT
ncbi:hypothetical protein GCM10027074_54280 [Streptomyces deserti]